MNEPSTIKKLALWFWRDGPVWIVVASILFLICANWSHFTGGAAH